MWTSYWNQKERLERLKETGDLRYIYQNELDKSYFQHDTAYEEFKDLPRRMIKHLW